MLHEFLILNADAIVATTCAKAGQRLRPTLGGEALRNGVPVFLDQLAETLLFETSGRPLFSGAIGESATKHGRDLLSLGLSVSEVVHVYGDICQAITELALAQNAPVTVDEFRILNRSLDTAIADAVTEHARLTASSAAEMETERLGHLAHELRNRVNTALLAFAALQKGTVAVNGSTGAVLARSLTGISALIESTVSEVRLAVPHQPRERIAVRRFLAQVAEAAGLLAQHHGARFSFDSVEAEVAVSCDPHLLMSAVMNLLQNAFKFTPGGGAVVLRSYADDDRVRIEVEDQCGGIADTAAMFRPFAERRGVDRSGLGLGLSIARRAVRAHGGDIQVHNTPGKGCVFTIDLPRAASLDPVDA